MDKIKEYINKFNNYINLINPATKDVIAPKMSIDQIIEYINNKKSWDLQGAKNLLDKLYEMKRLEYLKNKNKINEKIKQLDFYIDYLNYQITDLNYFQDHLLTLIATIFLPLSFITGFFGMNFKSMGVPSLKKGIFNTKSADFKIMIFSILIAIFIIYMYYGFLKMS